MLPGLSAVLAGTAKNRYQTLLMLHGDGVDGSTTITDSSTFARTCTPSGAAQIDTAFSQFGGSSILFSGTNSYITVAAAANAFDMGTGDFTIESWVRRNGDATPVIIGGIVTLDNSGLKLCFEGNGTTLRVEGLGSPPSWVTTVPNTTWTHVALTRENGICNLWQGGVSLGTWSSPNNITNGSANITIGSGDIPAGGSGNNLTGWLDDVRIVKGAALYYATFTPPSAALPNSP